jgi:glycosyltransferase EpsF
MKKVLHFIGGLDRAGTETWLLSIVRNLNSRDIRFDLVVHENKKYDYSEAFTKLGCKIFVIETKNPIKYIYLAYRLMKANGAYSAMDCHIYRYSALPLLAAFFAKIRVRIVHWHNSEDYEKSISGFAKNIISRVIIFALSTNLVAVSFGAKDNFAYIFKFIKNKIEVIYCGVDTKVFSSLNLSDLKKDLEIPSNSFVITHVGRFVVQKNHSFLIKVFSRVVQLRDDAFLLLIGKGEEMQSVRKLVVSMGLESRVRFLGSRGDVPSILNTITDVLVLPSLYEGLGLVLIESQITGTKCIASQNVPKDVVINSDLIEFCHLDVVKFSEKIAKIEPYPKVFNMQLGKFDIKYSLQKNLLLWI